MEPIENDIYHHNSNEIQLLKKKRNKTKSSKKNKPNKSNEDDSSLYETTLEIKQLLTNNVHNNIQMEVEKNEILENKEIIEGISDQNNNILFLLIKKTNIFFNTSENLFIKGRKDPDKFPKSQKNNPYYVQRFYFFSLYDKGIQMDKESWYSVTPEEISDYIASIIPNSYNSTILDAFCGCGGNSISFSKKFKRVFANDLYQEKISMTKNNARVYNCPDNIIYFINDFLTLNLEGENIDYVFLSPPWGGPEYKNEEIYSLKKWITPDIEKIIEKSFKISKNIMIYLPRNTDLEELANIIYKYDKDDIESLSNTILFDVKYLNSASKVKAILVSYGPKFNTVKVKLVKKYIVNSIFQKYSNNINLNKMKKQLNILKIIGYSEYLKNFVIYKERKKDFSGNILLENLENFFVENIMDEKEKKQYESMNKTNIIDEGEKINENNNDKKDGNIEQEHISLINNEFVDLRQALTEEKFNEVKKDNFFV